MVYRVFSVRRGVVEEGATVGAFTLRGGEITIPAILVGERGRGRELGVLPVHLSPEDHKRWLSGEEVRIVAASLTSTKSGRPKLIAHPSPTTDTKAIAVLRTPIGFRGSNSHTGDRLGWECRNCGYREESVLEKPSECPKCGEGWWGPRLTFAPFPGEVLVRGVIAQGDAGRMGSGDQLVALIHKGAIFRTGYSGRLYGAPPAHYYLFDGERILSATWEERAVTEIF